jgi:hypothetical protein
VVVPRVVSGFFRWRRCGNEEERATFLVKTCGRRGIVGRKPSLTPVNGGGAFCNVVLRVAAPL